MREIFRVHEEKFYAYWNEERKRSQRKTVLNSCSDVAKIRAWRKVQKKNSQQKQYETKIRRHSEKKNEEMGKKATLVKLCVFFVFVTFRCWVVAFTRRKDLCFSMVRIVFQQFHITNNNCSDYQLYSYHGDIWAGMYIPMQSFSFIFFHSPFPHSDG